MKTSLTGRRPPLDVDDGRLRSGFLEASLALQLLDLPLVKIALQPADAVDEQLAVEVIDLMLERHGEQAFGLEAHFLLLRRERPHEHARCPLHLRREVDDREAAFLP